jgi:hypothetical protein
LYLGEGVLNLGECKSKHIASWNWNVNQGTISFVLIEENPSSQRSLCITAFPLCGSSYINWDDGCSLTSSTFPSIYPCFHADNVGDGEIEILSSGAVIPGINDTALSLKVTGVLNSLFSLKYWTGKNDRNCYV